MVYTKLYTLNGQSDPTYLIGPWHDRRLVDRSNKSRCHDLAIARQEHRRLKAEIELLDIPRCSWSSQQLKKLKAEKLRLKDTIVRLSKAQEERTAHNLLQLGAGGFGKVMFANCIATGHEVAVKLASPQDFNELYAEHASLQLLQQSGEPGFPKVFYFGQQDVPVVSTGLTVNESLAESASEEHGTKNVASNSKGSNEVLSSSKGLKVIKEHPFDVGRVVLVMEVLGPSLDKLLYETTLGVQGFSQLTVLRLAVEMLERLSSLSKHGIVHGDIQPGNFLMGKELNMQQTVHLIDFGLSSMVMGIDHQHNASNNINNDEEYAGTLGTDGRMSRNGSKNSRGRGKKSSPVPHDPMSTPDLNKSHQKEPSLPASGLRGTLEFSSSRVLRGQAACAADDLESLAYCLAYLLQGKLPWSCPQPQLTGDAGLLEISNMATALAQVKASITPEELCSEMSGCTAATVISYIVIHSRELDENSLPDFERLLRFTRAALENFEADNGKSTFDWEKEGISWSEIDGGLIHQGY